MSKETPQIITQEHVVAALWSAIDAGWLQLVEYGYCFYCDGMGVVYEVISKDVPAQPPRCQGCFITHAFDMIADKSAMKELLDDYDLLTLEPDDDGSS